MEENKVYLPIGSGRLLDIVVFLDDKEIYKGRIEDAPEEIKELKYSKVKVGTPMLYYVYSSVNNITFL